MTLELTSEEIEALAQVLRAYIPDLRMEVADTDRKRLRDELKQRERLLAGILRQIVAGVRLQR